MQRSLWPVCVVCARQVSSLNTRRRDPEYVPRLKRGSCRRWWEEGSSALRCRSPCATSAWPGPAVSFAKGEKKQERNESKSKRE